MNIDFLHHNSISVQGLKLYNRIIFLYIYTLRQILQLINANIDIFCCFYTHTSISMRCLKVYKENFFVHIHFNTNIGTNQCKY